MGDWTCLRRRRNTSGRASLRLQTWGWTSTRFTGRVGLGALSMVLSSAKRWSPASAGTDELEERLRSHYESLSRVIRFTRTADAKAAPVLALQIALVGALATRFEELYNMMVSGTWDAERTAVIGLAIVYGLLLTAVIVLAAWVYLPKNAQTCRSLIFFEDIGGMEWGEFSLRRGT